MEKEGERDLQAAEEKIRLLDGKCFEDFSLSECEVSGFEEERNQQQKLR